MKKIIISFFITMIASSYAQAALNYLAQRLQSMPTSEQQLQFEASFDVMRGMFSEVHNLERNVWLQEKTLPSLELEINRVRDICLIADEHTNLERLNRTRTTKLEAINVYKRLAGYYRVLINDYRNAFGIVGIDLGLDPVSQISNHAEARRVGFADDVHGVFTGPSDEGISSEEFKRLTAARKRLRYQIPPFHRTRRFAADAVDNAAEMTIPTLQEDGSLLLARADGTFIQTEKDTELAQLYAREDAQDKERERRIRNVAASKKIERMTLLRIKRAEKARQRQPLERRAGGLLNLEGLPPAPIFSVDVDYMSTLALPRQYEVDVDEVYDQGTQEKEQILRNQGIECRARVERLSDGTEAIFNGKESTV